MKKIRILSFLLCLAMLLSLMAGCDTEKPVDTKPKETQGGSNQPGETKPIETEDTGIVTAPGVLPIVKEGNDVTLTIGLKLNSKTEDYDTNDFTLWLEEQTGINLEFEYFSSSTEEALTQLALKISGGEKLPDILWDITGFPKATMYEYGEDGYFIDLNPYFEKYAHYWYESYDIIKNENDKDLIFTLGKDPSNGELYAFPEYQSSNGSNSVQFKTVINTKWLETVDEEIPTTVDDLYRVLQKFATMDPNGNGKADEMPLVGGVNLSSSDIIQFLTNAFVRCYDSYFFNVTDGKVWDPYRTDEYRQAMIYLNKLYSEGLINPVTYSLSSETEMLPIFTPADGVAIAGVVGANWSGAIETDNEVIFDYTYLPALEGATSLGGHTIIPPMQKHYDTFITSDCEYPEVAFRLLDFMSGKEGFLRARFGVLGRDWEWAAEGAKDKVGQQATLKVIDNTVFTKQSNATWHNLGSTICLYDVYGLEVAQGEQTWSTRLTAMTNQWCFDHLAARSSEEVIEGVVYLPEDQERVSEVSNILKDYVQEARGLFVTGVMNPNNDNDWQAFISALENQGIDDFLAITQRAYDNMNGK